MTTSDAEQPQLPSAVQSTGASRDPFKRCTDCQEIAIIAKVPYTPEQFLMNVVDLLHQCRIYTRDLEDWDRCADSDKTWMHIRPFIQEAYQQRLQLGV